LRSVGIERVLGGLPDATVLFRSVIYSAVSVASRWRSWIYRLWNKVRYLAFGIHYNQPSFPLCQLQSWQWHPINTTATYQREHGTVYATQFIVPYR